MTIGTRRFAVTLEDNPAAPVYLKTEPGVGYRLKV